MIRTEHVHTSCPHTHFYTAMNECLIVALGKLWKPSDATLPIQIMQMWSFLKALLMKCTGAFLKEETKTDFFITRPSTGYTVLPAAAEEVQSSACSLHISHSQAWIGQQTARKQMKMDKQDRWRHHRCQLAPILHDRPLKPRPQLIRTKF